MAKKKKISVKKVNNQKLNTPPIVQESPFDPVKDGLIIFFLTGLFLILKSYSLNPAVSDENIYFYAARLMSQGHWPYKDFFFAHPPLHLIPGWLIIVISGGFNFITVKMLPIFAAAATGICVYIIARRAGGTVAAFSACAMFLFSHDLLRASSHWTGINWSVAFLAGGLSAALNKKEILGGILLSLGVCTGVYIAPGALIIIAIIMFTRPKDGIRCLKAAFLTWLIVNGLFFLIGGKSYIDGVYRYHLLKPPAKGSSLFDQIDKLLFHNFFILTAPIYLSPVLFGWVQEPDRYKSGGWKTLFDPQIHPGIATGLWCVFIWLGYFFFLGNLSRVFHFYFLLVFPAGAVCGGIYLSKLSTYLRQAKNKRSSAIAAGVMLAAIVTGIFIYPSLEHGLAYFPRSQGTTKTYDFPHSPLPETIQTIIKQFLWQPDRTIGKRYTGIQYYLWHESRDFGTAAEIAEALRNAAQKNEAIFGDSTSTPLVALLADIPIVDNFIDTNAMRFHCNLPSAKQAVADLKATFERTRGGLNWVLINPLRGLARFKKFQQFFRKDFKPFMTFQSPYHGTYILLQRATTNTELR